MTKATATQVSASSILLSVMRRFKGFGDLVIRGAQPREPLDDCACRFACNAAHVAHGRGAAGGDAFLGFRDARVEAGIELLAPRLGGGRGALARLALERLRASPCVVERL